MFISFTFSLPYSCNKRHFGNRKGGKNFFFLYKIRKRRRWRRKWSSQIDYTFVTRIWEINCQRCIHSRLEFIFLSTSIPTSWKILLNETNKCYDNTHNYIVCKCVKNILGTFSRIVRVFYAVHIYYSITDVHKVWS